MSNPGSPLTNTTAAIEADNSPFLSVVIPTRNEVSRLVPTVKAIAGYLRKQGLSFEVIIADDASSDDSVKRCQALGYDEVRILSPRIRSGRGAAIRDGLFTSRGAAILLADACLTAPVTDILPMVESLLDADIVLGSTAPASRTDVLSSGYLARSGFKLFRRDAGSVLYDVDDFDDGRFDAEVLFVADRFGLHTVTYPTRHETTDRARISPFALAAVGPYAPMQDF